MVWLGKKVFDMRHQLSVKRKLIPEDEEKPFLDHLEDLRKSLSRIVATLLVGMVVLAEGGTTGVSTGPLWSHAQGGDHISPGADAG